MTLIDEASRGAAARGVKPTGFGFDPHSRARGRTIFPFLGSGVEVKRGVRI